MNISLAERVEGLSRIWSMAKYNFARWDELRELDWDAVYRAALSRVIASEDAAAYYAELSRFVALLRDGHSYVTLPDELQRPYLLAFGTSHRWGGHIVNSVPKGCGVPPLSEILAVNGTPLREYLEEKVFPFMWRERENAKFYYGQLGYEIMCREGDRITIDTDSGSFTVKNNTVGDTDDPPDLNNSVYEKIKPFAKSANGYSLYVTGDGIGVFNIWSCNDWTLRDALYSNIDKFRDCRGFILDLRDNNGGSGLAVQPLAQMFFEGEIFAGTEYTPMYLPTIAAMAQYRYPQNRYEGLSDADAKLVRETAEHKAFRATEERFYIRDCPAYLPQPLTVLSSSRTASAAEYLLSALKYKNRAVIVGEASYGSTGQPIFGALPGGGSVAICTAKCVMPDGFDYNNVGIPADVEVESTREDAMRGYDYIFEKGLEVLRGLI